MTGSPSRGLSALLTSRGAGLSGLGEAAAAMLVATPVSIIVGLGHGPVPLLLVLAMCGVAAISGRWPYAAALVGSLLAAAIAFVSATVPGYATTEAALVATYVLVEAVGTTGNRRWTAAVAGFQVVLWLLGVAVEGRPDAGSVVIEVVVIVATFAAVAALGLARHRWRSDKVVAETRRSQDLAALRRDIARDLHDSVAHDITEVVLLAGQAQTMAPSPEVAAQLTQIVSTGQRSLTNLRAMLGVLRREGSAGGAVWVVSSPTAELERSRTRLREAGFVADARASGSLDTLPTLAAEVLAKSLVECVSNVIKHGQPGTTVTVRLDVDDQVEMLVLNRPRPSPRSDPGRLGLIGIAERVESVGGSFEAGPRGEWWSAHVVIPLDGSSGHVPVLA